MQHKKILIKNSIEKADNALEDAKFFVKTIKEYILSKMR